MQRIHRLPSLLFPFLLGAMLLACGGSTEGPGERPALDPLTQPDLSSFAEKIQQQLENERTHLNEVLAEGSNAELAAAFGRMGQLYHAYSLPQEAAVCYRNAQRLDGNEPRWPYLLGVIAQTRGDNDAAAERFEQTLELLPGDTPARLRLAEMRLGANQSEEAQRIFEQVLADDPSKAYAHYGLGRLASEREDFVAAVEQFERALELQPEAKNVHYLLALAHRRLGNREEAERQLAAMDSSDVIFEDPLVEEMESLITGVGPILDRALEAYGAGRYDEAAAAYREALALEPENATALRSLGFTLQEAGRLEEAAEALREMVRVYPQHALGRLELSTVLLEKGDLEEAVASFRVALEQDPDFEQAHTNLGVALSRLERWPEAVESFSKALELDPRDQEARLQLAIALDELDREEESLALVRQIVAEAPNHWKARQRLGHKLFDTGDLEAAAKQHLNVVENEDAPADEKARAHYQLGRIVKARSTAPLDQDSLDEAVRHFREATVLSPEFWQARIALANTHRDAGRLAAAAAEYAQVVKAEPQNLLARLSEVKALLAADRHLDARRRLEEGLVALPRSAELAHLLARHLAVAPRPELRDGNRAWELANSLHTAFPTLEHAETVAMALAAQGRFEEAAQWQETLLVRAEGETPEVRERVRRNLEQYRRGELAGES